MFTSIHFNALTLDTLFTYCAYAGSLLYVIRLLLGFGGIIDSDASESMSDHLSDSAFEFLSFNTLVGFCMMFGWGGLAASRQFLLPDFISLCIAIVCGLLFVAMVKLIFKSAKKLVSPGSNFDIQKTIGKRGKVYQEIKENKRGVIQVVLDEFSREFDAISIDNREIPSFQAVEVLKVVDHKTVVVKRIK